MTETAAITDELSDLYLRDEVAWLEETVERIAAGAYDELDYANLREYLTDMANRDRREILSRLIVLIAHHLKWQYQPAGRSVSWQLTIAEQSQLLSFEFDESRVLRNHAEDVLERAFTGAVKMASLETKLPASAFPKVSPLTAKAWVALPVPVDEAE